MSGITQGSFPGLLERIVKAIPGGYKNKILFTPVENIIVFGSVNPTQMAIQTITVGTIPWGVASMPDHEKGFREESKDGQKGRYTETKMTGVLPFLSKTNTYNLNRLKYYRLIVIVPLRNGSYRVMGTPENGAHFDYVFDTGDTGGDVTKAKVSFNWTSEDGAPYYQPATALPI